MKRNINLFNTRISFFESLSSKPKPEIKQSEDPLYSCWAQFSNVWLKDIEIAKANNTLTDVVISIRDPLAVFTVKKSMLIRIDGGRRKGKLFRISAIQEDYESNRFINIIAKEIK